MTAKDHEKKHEYAQRLSPKLRMVINGDSEVNGYRSAISASVQSSAQTAEAAPQELAKASQHLEKLTAPPKSPSQKVKKGTGKKGAGKEEAQRRGTRTALVSCFVHLDRPDTSVTDLLGRGKSSARQDTLVTAELTPAEIISLSRNDGEAYKNGVAYIETGNPLSEPRPVASLRTSAEPPAKRPSGPTTQANPRVIVGIIDVGGFDFAHPDFVRGDKTRFELIWDQGGAKRTRTNASGAIPQVEYGDIITTDTMNQAIADALEIGVSPHDFVYQSSQRPGSHATHVASIAAGESGVCPEAVLVGVTIALAVEDSERRSTFFDSTRLAHAVDFLTGYAKNRGLPIAINISLGTNGHAHDGTSPIARWIDAALGEPGRVVCAAAGNSGQEAARFEGDLGHLSGRIHASGRIPASGLVADLQWQVVGNGIVDVSENELEIWYRAGDEFCVQVRSPSGFESRWVRPGQFYENERLPTDTFLSVYSERYHPANGENRISVFLSPKLKEPIKGIESGTWTVRLQGIEVRDGRYDAWIERDDPRPLGRLGESDAWLFPSYFSSRSNVDSNSVSSLACGRDVIAVGNADMAHEQIHISSSQGPTWDGRNKPDIAAPGSDIVAAKGFGSGEGRDRWLSMTGTSMASPYVTGVAARMLAEEPRLTAKQVAGIMRSTAQPLPGSDYAWQDDAGFGVIQAEQCLEAVTQPFTSIDAKDLSE